MALERTNAPFLQLHALLALLVLTRRNLLLSSLAAQSHGHGHMSHLRTQAPSESEGPSAVLGPARFACELGGEFTSEQMLALARRRRRAFLLPSGPSVRQTYLRGLAGLQFYDELCPS